MNSFKLLVPTSPLIKQALKLAAILGGATFGGFILYLLKYRRELMSGDKISHKEAKIIPVEEVEKILHKIKCDIVHKICIFYDQTRKNDENDTRKEKSLLINENPDEIYRSDSMLSDNVVVSDRSKIRLENYKNNYKTMEKNSKLTYLHILDLEFTNIFFKVEYNMIKKFKLEPADYYNSLKSYKYHP